MSDQALGSHTAPAFLIVTHIPATRELGSVQLSRTGASGGVGTERSRLRVRRHKGPRNGYVQNGRVISVNALPGVRASPSHLCVAPGTPSCRGPLSPAARAEKSAAQRGFCWPSAGRRPALGLPPRARALSSQPLLTHTPLKHKTQVTWWGTAVLTRTPPSQNTRAEALCLGPHPKQPAASPPRPPPSTADLREARVGLPSSEVVF